jgi:photosystem II stability/assembly factor-like uncharacterized protein
MSRHALVMAIITTVMLLAPARVAARYAPEVSSAHHQLLDEVQFWTVACRDTSHCLVAGGQAVPRGQQIVLASDDAGATWNEVQPPQNQEIYHLTCPTARRCFGLGVQYEAQAGTAQTSLLLSRREGSSWDSFPVESLGLRGGAWPADLACPAVETCYLAGTRYVTSVGGRPGIYPEIAITTNAGRRWRRVDLPNEANITLLTIACSDARTCLVGGSGHEPTCSLAAIILRTDDRGKSWERQYDACAASITALACPLAGTCYAGGYYGDPYQYANQLIVGTTDAGNRWSNQLRRPFVTLAHPTSWIVGPIQSMVCPGVAECFAVEENSVVGTQDGGKTWTILHQADGAFLTGIACPSAQVCVAAGSAGGRNTDLDSRSLTGLLLRTADGGKTWSSLP